VLTGKESDASTRIRPRPAGTGGTGRLRGRDGGSHREPVSSAFLKIYPPNQTSPVSVAFKALTCAKPVRTAYVSAVRPGNGGSV
jgi:hypothetical protein